jgi:DNA-binding SARP family transcriptional activator
MSQRPPLRAHLDMSHRAPPPATPAEVPSPSSVPSPATPASPSRTDPAAAPPTPTGARTGLATGVEIPGGWVTIPFAAAISGMGALVWIRRRRRYRYTVLDEVDPHPDTWSTDDPDLQPLPAVVDRLRRAVREHAPRLLDPQAPPTTVAEYMSNPAVYRPLIGPSGPELVSLADLSTPDGLGLTGPGALSAARALALAVLSSGGPQDPDASGCLVIPRPTWLTLLGDGVDATDLPRLHVTADVTDALTVIEDEYLQRRRTLEEYTAADLDQLREQDPASPPMPPLLLLAETPPDHSWERLLALIRLGDAVDIAAVLLGTWTPGMTIDLADDGHATAEGRPRRVPVLDRGTAVDLLNMLREAHTGTRVQPRAPEADTDPDTPARSSLPASGPQIPYPAGGPDEPDSEPPTACEATDSPAESSDNHEGTPTPGARQTATMGGPQIPPVRGRARVCVRVFGKVAVLDEAGNAVPGLRKHAGGLLIYLALHRTGADKNPILEAFWPEASLRRAAERLSTEVGNLRRSIHQAAGDRDQQPVVNTGGRYHLDPTLVDVDAWRFEDAVRQAGTATDPAQRLNALHAAVAAHSGPLAEGRDYHWLEPAREQLRRNGIRARLHLADLVSAREPYLAAELTTAAAELDPTSEELARLAMTAQAHIGDVAAVRAQLRQLRSALRSIDEEPSPEIVSLATHLQQQALKETSDAPALTNGLETARRRS